MTNSNSNILKKLDAFGKDHDAYLNKTKDGITKENNLLKKAKEKYDSVVNNHSAYVACSASCTKEVDCAKKEVQDLTEACHPGFVVSFDNIDIHVQHRNMTTDSQNRDFHWINHQVIENRVSGATLNSSEPQGFLSNVSNLQFLPTLEERNWLPKLSCHFQERLWIMCSALNSIIQGFALLTVLSFLHHEKMIGKKMSIFFNADYAV